MTHDSSLGGLIVHPVVVVSTVVLLMNDHVLKASFPGLVTGKVSDVAGLIVAPAVLIALLELISRRRLTGRPVILLTAVVAVGFAAVQLLQPMNRLYAHALGIAQWLALDRDGTPLPVLSVADPLDLLTLPAALVVPWLTGAARPRPVRHPFRRTGLLPQTTDSARQQDATPRMRMQAPVRSADERP